MTVPEWLVQLAVALLAGQTLAASIAGFGGWILWRRFYHKEWPDFVAHFGDFEDRVDTLHRDIITISGQVLGLAERLKSVERNSESNDEHISRIRERLAGLER